LSDFYLQDGGKKSTGIDMEQNTSLSPYVYSDFSNGKLTVFRYESCYVRSPHLGGVAVGKVKKNKITILHQVPKMSLFRFAINSTLINIDSVN